MLFGAACWKGGLTTQEFTEARELQVGILPVRRVYETEFKPFDQTEAAWDYEVGRASFISFKDDPLNAHAFLGTAPRDHGARHEPPRDIPPQRLRPVLCEQVGSAGHTGGGIE